nr:transposase [Bradyrhizobium sp. JYMT SZCCT0428]
MLLAERIPNERLRQIIKELQRHRFGRRAETLPEDQMLLGLEDVEQTAASDAAIADRSAAASRAARAEKRRINRGSLPAHLPWIEFILDIDGTRARATNRRRHADGSHHRPGPGVQIC